MHRNLEERIEVITQVIDESLCVRLWHFLQILLADERQVWDLHGDGRYVQRTPSTDASPTASLGIHQCADAVRIKRLAGYDSMRDPLILKGLICGFRLCAPQPMTMVELDDVTWDEPGAEPMWLHQPGRHAGSQLDRELRCYSARGARTAAGHRPPHRLRVGPRRFVRGGRRLAARCVERLPESFDLLRFFVNAKLVVSVRMHPLQGIDRLRRDAQCGLVIGTPPHSWRTLDGGSRSCLLVRSPRLAIPWTRQKSGCWRV